jgi:C4-dicarboxylate-specific signal transduction histidine kinase
MDRRDVEQYRLALFGRMVMGVAHEVDNHLSVVLGFSELIRMAASNERKVSDGAGKILSAGERTGTIIRHFSNYVRPHKPAMEPFAPADMIPEMLAFAKYDLGRNSVMVAAPASVPPGLILGDKRDLALALLALLFNGSESMAGKGGELAINVTRDESDWGFTVSDQGGGVAAELEERIFEERFGTRTEPFHAGMGLPVARHLVSVAGGSLRLENVPGGGCVATVRVPPKPPA